MEADQDTFSIVEYLSVFTAFIYGYVATRFFSGWGAMINFRHGIKFSKEHLFWTFLTFGLLIDVWWGSWIKSEFISEYVLLYYLSLAPTLIFFLISVVLFPPLRDERFMDLKKYFEKTRKRNYILFFSLFITFELSGYFYGSGPLDTYFNFIVIAIAMMGYFVRKAWIHYSILTIAFIGLIVHIGALPSYYQNLRVINDFSLTEYLTIFIAFIYGSIASRFFTGWGIMISKYDRITFSKDHIGWTFLAFGLLLDFWTGSWLRERFLSLSIYYFIISLLVPIAFYALTSVLFPVIRSEDRIDLRIFYWSHKKIIFFLFGLTVLMNAITANLMEDTILLQIENVFRLVALIIAAIAYYTRRNSIERAVLIAGATMLVALLIVEPRLY